MRDHIYNQTIINRVPEVDKIECWLSDLYKWMFVNSDCRPISSFFDQEKQLYQELEHILITLSSKEQIRGKVLRFFSQIEELYIALELDIRAYLTGDFPFQTKAAVIAQSSGFFATFIYRVAVLLQSIDTPEMSYVACSYAKRQTGIEIAPLAKIGESFTIDSGFGVVISQTVQIANHVRLANGVVLGLSHHLETESILVDDHVSIKANAIIGGDHIHIGKHCIVEQGCIVSESIKANNVVSVNQIKKLKKNKKPLIIKQ